MGSVSLLQTRKQAQRGEMSANLVTELTCKPMIEKYMLLLFATEIWVGSGGRGFFVMQQQLTNIRFKSGFFHSPHVPLSLRV